MIQFTVYGPPVAQGRPRAGKTKSGDVVMYDPGKSKDYKRYVSLVAGQNKPTQLIENAVSLTSVKMRKRKLRAKTCTV